MRFNAKELLAVATQPSNHFDKEGILLLKEKKEGLFRKSDVFNQRWFRLRGNLLFYFKNEDQCSEPAGVFVLEQCEIVEDDNTEVPYSFILTFHNDEHKHVLAALSESERELWIEAISKANFECMQQQLVVLKTKLKEKSIDIEPYSCLTSACKRHRSFSANAAYNLQSFEPCLELSLSCDNLKCDGDGLPPNPLVCISLNSPPSLKWMKFSQTEVIERSSNPCFLTTATFFKGEVTEITQVKVSVYHVRERLALTSSLLGDATFTLDSLMQSQHHTLRLPLKSPSDSSVGFITVCARELNNSLPRHAWLLLAEENSLWSKVERPRSYSLPSRLSSQVAVPVLGQLKFIATNFTTQTYRFHTGLGAELHVHEIMAESKLSLLIPCMLLNLWVNEEKSLMDRILKLGELPDEWRQKQLAAAESHLQLVNQYTEQLDFLSMRKDCTFKPSILRRHPNFEFIPVNLHLQRMWVQNVTTRKTGVYDIITVGAFSAFSMGFSHGGLLRLLNQLKSYCTYVRDHASAILGPDPISRAAEAIYRIDQLHEEIEKDLRALIVHLDQKEPCAAQEVLNSLSRKGNQLTHVCIPQYVEDMLTLWESMRSSDSAQYSSLSNKDYCSENIDSSGISPLKQKANSLNTAKPAKDDSSNSKNLNVVAHEEEDCKFFSSDMSNENSQIKLSDEELSAKNRNISPCVPQTKEEKCADELEPLDLLHVNIKASIMCMASKVQSFSHASMSTDSSSPSKCGSMNIDWTMELMPSIKKLRQAISHLERTASLTYGLISMKECDTSLKVNQEVRHRRDVVFSQALTALVTGLMTRLWCQNPDAMFMHMLRAVGVYAHFEGLLSCFGDEIGTIEDMIVGVDDLRRVLFWLEPCGASQNPQPRIVGSRLFLSVVIPVPESVIALLPKECALGCNFTVCSVFFNIGINEKATLSEKTGQNSLQDKLNQDSLSLLREHFCRFKRAAKAVRNQGFRFSENLISDLLDRLESQIHAKKSKNVEILHIAAEVCRHLGGIRFTSCKSAKDRTGMSATLEQTMVLMKDFNLDENEMIRALECMRSEGTRRENALKNVGVRKYHITKIQLMTFPKLYCPPAGTYGTIQS